jgi:hypothetical protein
VPHHNVPGPARLELEAADTSGKVNSAPMFIADRLAITNHVMAYAHLIDDSARTHKRAGPWRSHESCSFHRHLGGTAQMLNPDINPVRH